MQLSGHTHCPNASSAPPVYITLRADTVEHAHQSQDGENKMWTVLFEFANKNHETSPLTG